MLTHEFQVFPHGTISIFKQQVRFAWPMAAHPDLTILEIYGAGGSSTVVNRVIVKNSLEEVRALYPFLRVGTAV